MKIQKKFCLTNAIVYFLEIYNKDYVYTIDYKENRTLFYKLPREGPILSDMFVKKLIPLDELNIESSISKFNSLSILCN